MLALLSTLVATSLQRSRVEHTPRFFRVWRGDEASFLTTQHIPTEWRRSVDGTVADPPRRGSTTVKIEMSHDRSRCPTEDLRRHSSRSIRRRIGTRQSRLSLSVCRIPRTGSRPKVGTRGAHGDGGRHQIRARRPPEECPDRRATGKRAWGATTRGSECRRPWSWPGCPPHLSRLTTPERAPLRAPW